MKILPLTLITLFFLTAAGANAAENTKSYLRHLEDSGVEERGVEFSEEQGHHLDLAITHEIQLCYEPGKISEALAHINNELEKVGYGQAVDLDDGVIYAKHGRNYGSSEFEFHQEIKACPADLPKK